VQEDVDLIVLILKSKSIESKEDKQNWFNLLALMTSEQIEKLRNILLKERKKIEEIETKYEKKKIDIKKKFLEKWQEM
jgi:BMFP domain-containing protein YqiC